MKAICIEVGVTVRMLIVTWRLEYKAMVIEHVHKSLFFLSY